MASLWPLAPSLSSRPRIGSDDRRTTRNRTAAAAQQHRRRRKSSAAAQSQQQRPTRSRKRSRQLTPQQQRQRQMSQRQQHAAGAHGRNGTHCRKHRRGRRPQSLRLAAAEGDRKGRSGKRGPRFLKLIGANWIWSPAYAKDEVPVGDCYFRKTFSLQAGRVRRRSTSPATTSTSCTSTAGWPAGAPTGGRWTSTTSTKSAAARHECRGDQGDEHRRRRGRPGGPRGHQGARRHVRKLLDRRHLADERQAVRRLDAAATSATASGCRPRCTARSAACCRGATRSSSPTKARGS